MHSTHAPPGPQSFLGPSQLGSAKHSMHVAEARSQYGVGGAHSPSPAQGLAGFLAPLLVLLTKSIEPLSPIAQWSAPETKGSATKSMAAQRNTPRRGGGDEEPMMRSARS